VLDYGCGNGRFIAEAHRLFGAATAHGVDYQTSAPPIFALAPRPGLHYLKVDQFEQMSVKYDVILLRHVLEHTHHPVALLERLAARLKPGGVLYIEVPNLNAGCARVFGGAWSLYYLPRHIFHYSPRSLASIIARAGLRGEVKRTEIPVMGNMIAVLLNLEKSNVLVQTAGILLHPMQQLIELSSRSSTALHSTLTLP
jgi:2-polyprenyl-3-methyl-5-hydroxy-6-metoxy-1,4-benzoquinol methylase